MKKIKRLVAGGAVIAAVVALTPGAAQAASTSCSFGSDPDNCVSGPLAANRTYKAIHVQALAGSASAVECRVYDISNNVVVGRVTDYSGDGNTWAKKTIRGLYGTYRLGCGSVGTRTGGGQGVLFNDDFYVR